MALVLMLLPLPWDVHSEASLEEQPALLVVALATSVESTPNLVPTVSTTPPHCSLQFQDVPNLIFLFSNSKRKKELLLLREEIL
jgi:hypothetical protein